MTIEEELAYLREENKVLRKQLARQDEIIQHHGEQMSSLSEQIKALQDWFAKDSHNSHLPPSSDRFVRKPKSLRKKSKKKSGEQSEPRGSSLRLSSTSDEIIEQCVDHCEVWAADLKDLLLYMKQASDQTSEQAKSRLDPLEVADWKARFLELLDEREPASCSCASWDRRTMQTKCRPQSA